MASAQMGKHPMLDAIAKALQHGPNDTLVFAPDRLQALQREALAITRGEELYALVGDLLGFAGFLRTKKASPAAAEALLDMALPIVERLEAAAKKDVKLRSQQGAELRKRIDKEKKSLSKAQGPSAALGPATAGGVGLRKRR